MNDDEARETIVAAIEHNGEMRALKCCALLVNTSLSRFVALVRAADLPDLSDGDGSIDVRIAIFLFQTLMKSSHTATARRIGQLDSRACSSR